MFDSILTVITGVLVPVMLLVIGWAGRMQKGLNDLRLKVAEEYMKGTAVEKAIDPIFKDLEWTKRVLIRIADKLNVDTDR